MSALNLGRNRAAADAQHGEIRFYCWACLSEWAVSVHRVGPNEWKHDETGDDLCGNCGHAMVPVSEYVESAASPTDTTEENTDG